MRRRMREHPGELGFAPGHHQQLRGHENVTGKYDRLERAASRVVLDDIELPVPARRRELFGHGAHVRLHRDERNGGSPEFRREMLPERRLPVLRADARGQHDHRQQSHPQNLDGPGAVPVSPFVTFSRSAQYNVHGASRPGRRLRRPQFPEITGVQYRGCAVPGAGHRREHRDISR